MIEALQPFGNFCPVNTSESWAGATVAFNEYLIDPSDYAKKVLSVATITPPAELAGLGEVRLDAFIVRSNTSLPGDGHWESAAYIREDWERVLGTASIIR